MRCAWKELMSILPMWMRSEVDELGKDHLQEVRMRLGLSPELVRSCGNIRLKRKTTIEDIHYTVNAASRYSPWAAATAAQGYITAQGGHRIGLCGEAVVQAGLMTGLRQMNALCIRVARDFPGLADKLNDNKGSVLIIGSPGAGKTTLLRDLIRQRSEFGPGSVAVVDERGELFPSCGCFPSGSRTDILTGCSKQQGVGMLLRTMGPATIAMDEITSEQDCEALIKAGWCGVKLLATAHAATREELYSRAVYKPLIKSRIFDTVVVLRSDKSWKAERMEL